MKPLALLDLFSGIGGFSLGLERSGGFQTVAFCEIDLFCRRVLARHWPGVPQYDDVRTLTAKRLAADGIRIDAVCGGFPCQDISEANVGGSGIDGAQSGLWAEYARIICEVRPSVAIVENVPALLYRGFGRVLSDLSSLGYDALWRVIPARDVGAQHERERLWIIAYPNARGRRPILSEEYLARQISIFAERQESAGRYAGLPEISRHTPWPEVVDHLGRLADGVSGRLDGWNAYANAVIPDIPEIIGRAWMAQRQEAAE
jgi:DNA (cytosine-5)-methyltransferase 1